MPEEGKKGITVKVDAGLHSEVRQYLEDHGMTMAEFVTMALTDELRPKYNRKEEKNMENMRTLAIQVPEELFQRIKDYLQRSGMTQKEFVIGLIETELERDLVEREGMSEVSEEQQETVSEEDLEAVTEENEEVDDSEAYDEDEDEGCPEDENEEEEESEDEGMGFAMGM